VCGEPTGADTGGRYPVGRSHEHGRSWGACCCLVGTILGPRVQDQYRISTGLWVLPGAKRGGTLANVVLNPGLQQLGGRVAGFVDRVRNGTQTISKVPDLSEVAWSPAQGEHRQRCGLPWRRPVCVRSMSRKPGSQANAHSIWRSPIISGGGICWWKRVEKRSES